MQLYITIFFFFFFKFGEKLTLSWAVIQDKDMIKRIRDELWNPRQVKMKKMKTKYRFSHAHRKDR